MKPPRQLIVTGDDFGSSHDVNLGILEAHQRGILTGASLMVSGEAFEEAVTLARQHPRMAVGLHLVVVSGRPVLGPGQIPHLVDSAGNFSASPLRAGLRYQFQPEARLELRLEIRAQLEKFRATGLPLSHVDGHLHMQMHPVVLSTLIECAGEFGIRAIRLPSEELGVALALDRTEVFSKWVHAWIFHRLRRFAEGRLKAARIGFAERVYGLLQTGRMTEEYLLGLIPKIEADRVEIYSHPTVSAHETSLGASRAQLDALVSHKVRQICKASGFQLSTYG